MDGGEAGGWPGGWGGMRGPGGEGARRYIYKMSGVAAVARIEGQGHFRMGLDIVVSIVAMTVCFFWGALIIFPVYKSRVVYGKDTYTIHYIGVYSTNTVVANN